MLSGSDLAGLNDFADKAVVLIGSGPANLGLAEELTDSGINTLLIEGGEADFSTRSQELYDGQSVGSYHLPYGLSGSRMRFLGGSSNCWAGGCGVLSDIDFKPRPWIPNSGWPISDADLTPYYEDAYGFFSLRPDYDALSENPFSEFEARQLVFTNNLRLKDTKVSQLKAHKCFRILVGYSLVDLEISENKLSRITLKGFDQYSLTLRPMLLVLGCGGIENARILLNACATSVNPKVFGSALGKYFCEHPIAPIATIIPANDEAASVFKRFDASSVGLGGLASVGKFFELPEKLQRNGETVNVALQVMSDQEGLSEAQMAVAELRSLIKNGALDEVSLASLYKIVSNPVEVMDAVFARLMQSGSRLSLRFQSEQAPNQESFIQLSDERDAFGSFRSSLKWSISDIERRSVEYAAACFASQIQSLGLGTILLDPFFLETSTGLPHDLRGGQHHCGTTRMGQDERTSVVDSNCKCHNVENLFITGSSVFPTNGWINPTLTIVALSKRLGRHLVTTLKPSALQPS